MAEYIEYRGEFDERPRLLKRIEDLPVLLQQVYKSCPIPKKSLQAIFIAPQQIFYKHGKKMVPEQALLFTSNEVIHLQAPSAKNPDGCCIVVNDNEIFFLRLTLVLMYARLEISASGLKGLSCIDLEFEVSGHPLIEPYLKKTLTKAWVKPADRKAKPPDRNSLIAQLPYKFKNGLTLFALQPEEILQGCLYQPTIKEKVLGLFPREICPKIAIALTDRQLIFLEEIRARNELKYGWVITFCPLQKIQAVKVIHGRPLNQISFHLESQKVSSELVKQLNDQLLKKWENLWASRYN